MSSEIHLGKFESRFKISEVYLITNEEIPESWKDMAPVVASLRTNSLPPFSLRRSLSRIVFSIQEYWQSISGKPKEKRPKNHSKPEADEWDLEDPMSKQIANAHAREIFGVPSLAEKIILWFMTIRLHSSPKYGVVLLLDDAVFKNDRSYTFVTNLSRWLNGKPSLLVLSTGHPVEDNEELVAWAYSRGFDAVIERNKIYKQLPLLCYGHYRSSYGNKPLYSELLIGVSRNIFIPLIVIILTLFFSSIYLLTTGLAGNMWSSVFSDYSRLNLRVTDPQIVTNNMNENWAKCELKISNSSLFFPLGEFEIEQKKSDFHDIIGLPRTIYAGEADSVSLDFYFELNETDISQSLPLIESMIEVRRPGADHGLEYPEW